MKLKNYYETEEKDMDDLITYRHPRTLLEAFPHDYPEALERPAKWTCKKTWLMVLCVAMLGLFLTCFR